MPTPPALSFLGPTESFPLGRQHGSEVKSSSGRKRDCISHPSSSFFLLVHSLQALLLPRLCLSDGSITGAMLRELLKLSLSGCVSSNVGLQPPNLLTVQEKRERRRKRMGGRKKSRRLVPPSPTHMTPTGSHRALNFAGRPLFAPLSPPPRFLSHGPQTPIYRRSHIGPFCLVGPEQLHSAEKRQQIKK